MAKRKEPATKRTEITNENISGSTRKRVGDFCMIRERWQKMRDDLHGQVLFVAEAVRLTLDDANGVVQSLDATERDFVFGLTVGNDAVPMTFDHLRELLERLECLAAIEVQILTVRQQGIAVPLDEAALLALHPPILGPAHVVERVVQMAQDVEFVEHDRGLGGGFLRRLP